MIILLRGMEIENAMWEDDNDKGEREDTDVTRGGEDGSRLIIHERRQEQCLDMYCGSDKYVIHTIWAGEREEGRREK